ncbi:DUF86 domain-containing protein [Alkalicoccus urumqiensis]|uniref:DUF86 domain-containing protein n=1 Tax=Alkalicoccus urumqiensis TaxID=1548213 RepID=A0A2P6MGX4_ALKUR|nr:DUF86 domain-containing protein [Alkalicoccus urumqiensis]PRO65531.1 DUF86 domain-containing protein [Alkalicoccus urumqiensis]
MYFVDRQLIEKRLVYIEELAAEIGREEPGEPLAVERACHMVVEACMDVGNQMIDGFIMRDPGSFEDICAILVDEKVLSASQGNSLERLLPWRKKLLQEYTDIIHKEMLSAYDKEIHTLHEFPREIRRYLQNELGPVSAFLPEDDE